MQPKTSWNGCTSLHIRSSSAYALRLDDLVTPPHLLYQAAPTETVEDGCRPMSFLRASESSRTLARLCAAGLPRVDPHGVQKGGVANVYRELFGPIMAHSYHPAMTR